jgi:HK97 family phage prohead protease
MADRAYSVLHIKSMDEGTRTIRGIATTPTPDRMGDVVVPEGMKFQNPMPLLWQHDSMQPVGTVNFDKPTSKGIGFQATIAKTDQPGTLKDRLDEAWQSVQLGLVTAVSVGFRALQDGVELLKDNSGLRFTATECFELSLVTIPANAQAVITSIKAMDTNRPGATAKEVEEDARRRESPAPRQKSQTVKIIPRNYK